MQTVTNRITAMAMSAISISLLIETPFIQYTHTCITCNDRTRLPPFGPSLTPPLPSLALSAGVVGLDSSEAVPHLAQNPGYVADLHPWL